jgi:hypothetical protein
MQATDLEIAIIVGAILIVLGVVPGLSQSLQDGIRNFSASLSSPFPLVPNRRDYEKLPRPLWLAVVGAGLILVSLLGYRP